MSKVRDIARRACRHLKVAASSVLDAIAGSTRGAHSAAADSDAQSQASGAHSMRSAHTNRSTRSNSTRSAHTARSRRPRTASARGAHSTGRAPRAVVPCNLQTAPAAARGYSMAEVLATVAIIVILCAIVAMNVVSFQANLRQKELDAKAEIIYTAAQEQFSRLMASGRAPLFAYDKDDRTNGVKLIPSTDAIPGDVDPSNITIEKNQICYLTSEELNVPDTPANILFGSGGLDDELLNDHWVIEYDYRTLTVYSVFYSASDSKQYNCASEYLTNFDGAYNGLYRRYAFRIQALKDGDAFVGYHGGGAGSLSSLELVPRIDVYNTEKLQAVITCPKPNGTGDLTFKVTISSADGSGEYTAYYAFNENKVNSSVADAYLVDISTNKCTLLKPRVSPLAEGGAESTCTSAIGNAATLAKRGLQYTLTLDLDSLASSDSRFTNLYGSGGNKTLTEGSDLRISVEVISETSLVQPRTYAYPESFNSLYASKSGSEALIKFGRHLQNLDESSGIGSAVTSAKLKQDIDFESTDTGAEPYDGWLSTYSGGYFNELGDGKPNFKPIANSSLASFNGKNSTDPTVAASKIKRLHAKSNGSAGLFGEVAAGSSLTLSNVVLTGTAVEGETVGGLVGTFAGDKLTIKDCQLYLNPATDIIPGITQNQNYIWLKGTVAGGLVGTFAGDELEITSSAASTVAGNLEKKGSTGGLVGKASGGSITISRSYADSYLIGARTGGLVGPVGDGAEATISSSFSAGFLTATTSAAGMVDGKAKLIEDSYTVCTTLDGIGNGNADENDHTHKVDQYLYVAASGTSVDNVHHLKIGPSADSTVELDTVNVFVDASTEGGSTADVSSKLCDDLNLGGGHFAASGRSVPYKLMNLGLNTYPWPIVLNEASSAIAHYGDWTAGFQEGTMVYYEKYEFYDKDGNLQSDKTRYGFEGAGVKSTLMDEASLNNQRVVVVGDGYAIVYAKNALPSEGVTISVKVTDPTTGYEVANESLDLTTKYTVSDTYDIYPLSVGLSNTEHVNGGKADGTGGYYLKAETVDSRSGGASISHQYWFNPHFAKTVIGINGEGTAIPELEPGTDRIMVRTARQLHNLSLYYKQYRAVTEGITFYQQRNIAFSEYQWSAFTGRNRVYEQAPIGNKSSKNNEDFSFIATYDGGCHEITDVSFATDTYDYVGLFGYVDNGGKVVNTVMCTDYTPAETYKVKRSGTLPSGTKLYMGVLIGYNQGVVDNCAAAGYYLSGDTGTVMAYQNTDVILGGLVGANSGTITNSSADSPVLRLSLTDANAWAGGFVGRNLVGGVIDNCYALGTIEVVDSEGSNGYIAGFAGANAYNITDCYCATAISASGYGVDSYGFAPSGGSVVGCTFLNNGTYSYIGKMYSYNFETDPGHTSGTPVSYDDMKVAETTADAVSKDNSRVHSQTVSNSGRFPYRGIVTYSDANGTYYVHYGNWQDDVTLGGMGIFYWEKEEGGSNDGYHMTYLGGYEETIKELDDNGAVISEKTYFRIIGDSSLCKSHNDGGAITEYGYGYYAQQDQTEKITATWSDSISCSASGTLININPSAYNQEASSNLKSQMENSNTADNGGTKGREFAFYAFTTSSDTNAQHISMKKGNTDDQDGTLTLDYVDVDDDGNAYKTKLVYNLSPFFANALNLDTGKVSLLYTGTYSGRTFTNADRTIATNFTDPALVYLDYSRTSIKDLDGTSVDYTKTIGTEDNQYETRSLQQLQYINWNGYTGTDKELVSKSNREQFNYLISAKTTDRVAENSVSKIEHIATTGTEGRAYLHWIQTHDIEEVQENHFFSPIAGTVESSQQSPSNGNYGYDAALCAWFGSYYSGQSYAIKNINIKSSSFHVGLFGTVVGAHLDSIVMYGDGKSEWVPTIERNTENDTAQVGAYALGALVGVAYDYNLDKPVGTITNCAVSGYRVLDSSTDTLGLGEANIGGLIGVANIGLDKCEAVADIVFNAWYKATAQYGIYVRVGGIAGATQATISNCYSGGKCSIGPKAMSSATPNYIGGRQYEIYIGGIAGSGFTSNYQNFTGLLKTSDGEPEAVNCYTYLDFPVDNFTKASSSDARKLIMFTTVSMADRQGAADAGKKAHIDNCYYLDSIVSNGNGVNAIYPTPDYYETRTEGEPVPLSYDEMSNDSFAKTLNGTSGTAWGKVTTTVDEGKGKVPGKYSFPSLSALDGKDYPFPTVIKQKDLAFSTVTNTVWANVHYGDWPIVGTYWLNGRDSMDIFSNMEMTGTADREKGWAYKECTLKLDWERDNDKLAGLGLPQNTVDVNVPVSLFTYYDGGGESATYGTSSKYAEVVKAKTNSDNTITVLIRAKAKGTTSVRFGGIETATFSLQVTDNWVITAAAGDTSTFFDATTNTVKLVLNGKAKLSLHAADADGINDFSAANLSSMSYIDWKQVTPVPSDPTAVDGLGVIVNLLDNKASLGFQRVADGTFTIMVTAVYHYQGQELQQQLFVTVVEPGVVGISNGDLSMCNEAKVGDPGNVADKDYSDIIPKPTYTLKNGDNLYLYASATDKDLLNTNKIVSVTIDDEVVYSNGIAYSDKKYSIEFGEPNTSGKHFAFLPAKVTYNNTAATDVPVVVALKDSTDDIYTLRTSINVTEKKDSYHLTLMNGGVKYEYGFGSLSAVSNISDLDYSSSDFANTQWQLEGWYSKADKTGEKVIEASGAVVSGSLDTSKNTTLYAKWRNKTATNLYVKTSGPVVSGSGDYVITSTADNSLSVEKKTSFGYTYYSLDSVSVNKADASSLSKVYSLPTGEYLDGTVLTGTVTNAQKWTVEDGFTLYSGEANDYLTTAYKIPTLGSSRSWDCTGSSLNTWIRTGSGGGAGANKQYYLKYSGGDWTLAKESFTELYFYKATDVHEISWDEH